VANIDKQMKHLAEHLDPGEEVLSAVSGHYETKKAGNDWNRKGALVATDRRLVFFAKKVGGYDLEVFPYSHISSFDSGKSMSGQKVTFFASGNTIHMKWINDKNLPEFIALVREKMEVAHRPAGAAASSEPPAAQGQPAGVDILEQIRKLGELRDAGFLTPDEFEAKKADLLSRM
jgi:hypothetical protein